MSNNLVEHAKRELKLCGQFEEDPAFAVSILAAVSAFASYPGHSGASAAAGIDMLSTLLEFKNLTPLTNNPDEWIKHDPAMWDGKNPVWQNKRNGEAFSNDGGQTVWYAMEGVHRRGENLRSEPVPTLVTHKLTWEPVEDLSAHEAVAQSIDHGEAYGVASANMAEPSDFVGGESDTEVRSYLCVCGDYHRATDLIWIRREHWEE